MKIRKKTARPWTSSQQVLSGLERGQHILDDGQKISIRRFHQKQREFGKFPTSVQQTVSVLPGWVCLFSMRSLPAAIKEKLTPLAASVWTASSSSSPLSKRQASENGFELCRKRSWVRQLPYFITHHKARLTEPSLSWNFVGIDYFHPLVSPVPTNEKCPICSRADRHNVVSESVPDVSLALRHLIAVFFVGILTLMLDSNLADADACQSFRILRGIGWWEHADDDARWKNLKLTLDMYHVWNLLWIFAKSETSYGYMLDLKLTLGASFRHLALHHSLSLKSRSEKFLVGRTQVWRTPLLALRSA